MRNSTIRQHSTELKELRQQHTNAESNEAFVACFLEPLEATVARPDGTFCTIGVRTDDDSIADATDSQTPEELARGKGKAKKQRKLMSKPRCRKYGKEYTDPKWAPFHVNKVAYKSNWDGNDCVRLLRNSNGCKVWHIHLHS